MTDNNDVSSVDYIHTDYFEDLAVDLPKLCEWCGSSSDCILLLACMCHSAILTGHIVASVAQLDAPSDWRPGGRGFNPRHGNILSWRLIMKYLLRSFSPFR